MTYTEIYLWILVGLATLISVNYYKKYQRASREAYMLGRAIYDVAHGKAVIKLDNNRQIRIYETENTDEPRNEAGQS